MAPLSQRHGRLWRIYCHALKEKLPLSMPVRITTCQMPQQSRRDPRRFYGDSSVMGTDSDYYLIRVHRCASWSEQVDTLEHEYAHCCHLGPHWWNPANPHRDDPLEDEDEVWAIWKQRCHRVLIETYAALPDELKNPVDRKPCA